MACLSYSPNRNAIACRNCPSFDWRTSASAWATDETTEGLVTVPGLTKPQRILRARKAAHDRWSKEDPTENAVRGQAGLRARFDREAREATPGLTDAEYARRAAHAYSAHMTGLALASSKARARKAGDGDAA